MFFVDKYVPKTKNESFFHNDILDLLHKMSKDNSFPHTIFYGPSGSGKKTIIRLFLEMLYGRDVNNISDSIYNVAGSGNTKNEVIIKQSNYHIVIEPNNNNFDRYIIQDVVKEYAKRIPLKIFTSRKTFKVVLINNIDNLPYYAQTALRRTMEKFSGTCRFIMWCRSLSKVIEPLRSRCTTIRVPSPSNNQMFEYLINISAKETINTTLKQYNQVSHLANGNIKKALWLLQLIKFGETLETSYDEAIEEIVNLITGADFKNIFLIRETFYNIIITNFIGSKIIKDVNDKIMQNNAISFDKKVKIAEIAAIAEHNLIRGRREIIHLEYYVTNVMRIIC